MKAFNLFNFLFCLFLAAAGVCAQTVKITPVQPTSSLNMGNVKLPELRAELLQRLNTDQNARREITEKYKGEAASEAMQKIDRENTAWIKEKMKEHGWLGMKLVGMDGAQAAFILVQHGVHDKEFQNKALELLKKAVKNGDALPVHLAYLIDRIRLAEGKQQVYGTQTRITKEGKFEVPLIEDEANVDKRRAEVGLEPLADYIQRMRQRYDKSPD